MSAVTIDEFTRLASVCRLDDAAAQRVFRALMESLARPGTCASLDLIPGVPPALVPLLAMCDLETSIAVCGTASEATSWASILTAVTGARRDRPESAGWLAVLDSTGLDPSLSARRGTPDAPETAARLVVTVDRLRATNGQHPAERATVVEVTGPGVAGSKVFGVEGIRPEFFASLQSANAFPCGLDVWLVDHDGRLVGLPRSGHFTASLEGAS